MAITSKPVQRTMARFKSRKPDVSANQALPRLRVLSRSRCLENGEGQASGSIPGRLPEFQEGRILDQFPFLIEDGVLVRIGVAEYDEGRLRRLMPDELEMPAEAFQRAQFRDLRRIEFVLEDARRW
jgi:hypothetical protein